MASTLGLSDALLKIRSSGAQEVSSEAAAHVGGGSHVIQPANSASHLVVVAPPRDAPLSSSSILRAWAP
jgi:hypothetical protein